MGLQSVIKKAKRKEKELRILMLGLDNAGKTTCVKKFNNEDTSTISPTLGFQISALRFRDYTLNIWDVGGQQSLRSYWRNYFESTDGIIWVVDGNDVNRLGTCRDELHQLLLEERLFGASLLVLINKQDIPTAMPSEKVAEILEVEELVRGKRNVHLQKCSAATGAGLLEGVTWLVEDIGRRAYSGA